LVGIASNAPSSNSARLKLSVVVRAGSSVSSFECHPVAVSAPVSSAPVCTSHLAPFERGSSARSSLSLTTKPVGNEAVPDDAKTRLPRRFLIAPRGLETTFRQSRASPCWRVYLVRGIQNVQPTAEIAKCKRTPSHTHHPLDDTSRYALYAPLLTVQLRNGLPTNSHLLRLRQPFGPTKHAQRCLGMVGVGNWEASSRVAR